MERLSSKFSDDIFALFTLFYLVKVWELSNQEQFVRPVYKYPFECKAPCIFCPLFSWNFTILSVTDPISQMTWKNQLLLRSLKWGLKHEPHHSDSFIRFYVWLSSCCFRYCKSWNCTFALVFEWSIHWINWNQKVKLKTKNQIFLLITFWLCYTL